MRDRDQAIEDAAQCRSAVVSSSTTFSCLKYHAGWVVALDGGLVNRYQLACWLLAPLRALLEANGRVLWFETGTRRMDMSSSVDLPVQQDVLKPWDRWLAYADRIKVNGQLRKRPGR